MNYFKTPFVLLATTFVAAVLATPINVIQRDIAPNNVSVTDQTNFVIVTNVLVQKLNRDFQKLSSTTANESDVQGFLTDLTYVGTNMNAWTFFMGSLEPLNGSVAGQALVNSAVSLFLSLNETAGNLTQQANATVRFGPLQFANVVASVTDLASGINEFNQSLPLSFTPDAVERVQPVSAAVDSVFNNTVEVFQYLFQDVKMNASVDVEDLACAFNATNAVVQKLDSDIGENLFTSTNETQVNEFFTDFSTAATGMVTMGVFIQMFTAFDEVTSQRLMNTTILPFYRTLNETAHKLTQEANITADLDPINFNLFLASITTMRSGFQTLDSFIRSELTQDVVIDELNALSIDTGNALSF